MRARNISKLGGRAGHPVLDGGDAFVPDFRHGFVEIEDGDAEAFGEEFILAATSAEAASESARDELRDDEVSGLTVDDGADPSPS